jgi:cyclophilin family peptidyl-prolyl cis-trans isomerase
LGNYNLQGHDDLVTVFRRSFISENMNVALTAITAFGKSNLRKGSGSHAVDDAISTLESFVVNSDNQYQWQLQAAAEVAIAQLEQKNAIALLHLERYSHVPLQSELLNACAITGAKRALDILLQYTMDENPILRRSALDGLMELYQHNRGDSTMFHRTYEAALRGLKEKDIAIVTSAASLLGDSLFLNRSSVEPLTDALSGLRLPDDVEVIQQVIATLEALHDPRAVGALKPWLESRERSIASVAAAALKSITGQDYSSSIPVYAEPLYTDFDFFYLHALPETVKVKMETIRGAVVMELYKNYAPFTVMSFLKLATQRGFYRGLSFHRVVPNFVVQGGDPRGDGWGGPGYAIRSEFSPLRFETGSVGMASSGKDTEGSQFFITHSPQPHLDGRYTIFGKVISGMDVVDKIQVDDHILDIEELKE